MTKLLALDTSTDACSVALYCAGDLQEEVAFEPRTHARRCLPMVNELLEKKGMALGELDAIAFGRGPGSFTGLRIAAGITQGLAFSAGLPVIPVSTLEAMAYSFGLSLLHAQAEPQHQRVVTLLDARMNEVYAASYDLVFADKELTVSAVSPEVVLPAEQVVLPDVPFSVVGSGLLYEDRLPARFSAALQVNKDIWPRASAIACLGIRSFRMGRTVSAEQAQPVYLRDEVAWKKMPGR